MIKRFFIIVALLSTVGAAAQEGTSSPYSYYGIGISKFKGTVENQSMGGLMVFSDSIHVNLRNPASYGRLRLTTYAVGASTQSVRMSTANTTEENSTTSLDYLAIGIPTGRLNFGVGVLPYSSVGYRIQNVDGTSGNQYTGRGGMNKAFLTTAFSVSPSFSLGVDVNYNFGNRQSSYVNIQENIQFGTREINRTDFMGFNYNFGMDFQKKLANGIKVHTAATYRPGMDINFEQMRNFATFTYGSQGQVVVAADRDLPLLEGSITLPEEYTVGAGFGRPNRWFIGGEYSHVAAANFNLSVPPTGIQRRYEDATQYRLGGFFVPNYTALNNYFNRIVYRAGVRYEESGLYLNNEGINEFGISFGLGLPAGTNFSNANIGFEYGQRGTTNSGLIKEEFFKISLSLSLNDRWFEQRRYD